MLKNLDQFIEQKLNLQQVSTFIGKHTRLLSILLLAGVMAYGYELFSFTLKIDSENHAAFYGPQLAWLSQGRWGMYVLSALLMPDAVMPFIPVLIAIAGCATGAMFFVLSLSDKRSIADYLAGAIAIACPVIYFAMYFTTLGYGAGIAFAVSSLGIYLLKQGSLKADVMAALCFTFGIGIYQAVLPLVATIFCLVMVASLIEVSGISFQHIFKQFVRFVITVLVATGVSQFIGIIMIKATKVPIDSQYLSQFIQFQANSDYLATALQATWTAGVGYYTGGKDYYLFDLVSLKLLFIFSLIVTAARIIHIRNTWLMRLLAILFLIAAIIAPMTMHVLNAGIMPPRTVLGISQVLAALALFSMMSSSAAIRLIAIVLTASSFYQFSMVNNRYAFSNQMTWLADRDLSVQLLGRIHEVTSQLPPKTDPYAQYPLEVVGWHEYRESPIFVHREVIGASFYTWGVADPERISRLFMTMGVTDFRPATNEEKLSVVEAAQAMPAWPYKGSVALINNIVVVKLSDYNPHEFEWMCQPPNHGHPACSSR